MKQLSSADIGYRSVAAGDRAFNFDAALQQFPDAEVLQAFIELAQTQRPKTLLSIKNIITDWDGVLGGGGEEMSDTTRTAVESLLIKDLKLVSLTADMSDNRKAQARKARIALTQGKKPDEDSFHKALQEHGLDPTETIMIGDHAALDKPLLASEHRYDPALLADFLDRDHETISTDIPANKTDQHRDRDHELFAANLLVKHHANSPMPEDQWRETIRVARGVTSRSLFREVIRRNPGIIQKHHLA